MLLCPPIILPSQTGSLILALAVCAAEGLDGQNDSDKLTLELIPLKPYLRDYYCYEGS